MTINYHTTQPRSLATTCGSLSRPTDPTLPRNRPNSVEPEGQVESVENENAATDDHKEVVPESLKHENANTGKAIECINFKRTPGWESLNTRLLREARTAYQKKRLAQQESLAAQREEVDAEGENVQAMRASYDQGQGKEANPNNQKTIPLVLEDRRESTAPITDIRQQGETGAEKPENLPGGISATMTGPLPQLAESVEFEKKRLNELEQNLEKDVSARLEAQSSEPVGTPYTAQSLQVRIAENDRDIAAVQSAMERRRGLEEREAKLARVGADLHDQAHSDVQAADHECRKREAGERHTVKVEALERTGKLEKEEQARHEAFRTKPITHESDRGLISHLRDNDWDIAAAQRVLQIRMALVEREEKLDLLEARVARRNRQIMNIFASDSSVAFKKGDGLSCNEVRAELDAKHELRLLAIYRQLTEYMQDNGDAAASSLLRTLTKVPVCTSSQLRLKNALVSAMQRHDAETGSREEPRRVSDPASISVAPDGVSMQLMPRYNTKPFTGKEYEVKYPSTEVDQEQAVKVEEGKEEEETQNAELPGTHPSGQSDSGAFVRDLDLGVHEANDSLDKVDQEQAIASELPVENTQLDRNHAQPPQLDVINHTSNVMLYVVFLYVMLWCYTYCELSQQIYLAPARVFVGFCALKDIYNLCSFRFSEYPDSIAFATLFATLVDYLITIHVTTWYGPTAALCIIWLVPFVTSLLQWCWNRSCSFENAYRGILPMQGPFPYRMSNEKRTGRLASFGVNPNLISLAILSSIGLEVVYCSLRYIALFSGESYLARVMAVLMYMFLPITRLCPWHQLVEEAYMMGHLLNREYYH